MNGVTFGDYHSFDDFGMILKSKVIPPPEPKTNFVEIPGADGSIDLSTALTNGKIKYKNRTLQFNFTLYEGDGYSITDIYNKIHGQELKIIPDYDSNYYYIGRCTVADSENNGWHSITVSCNVTPYKFKAKETTVKFDVTDNIIKVFKNDRMEVVPQITVSQDMECEFRGATYKLTNLIQNGDFSNETAEWTSLIGSTLSSQDNILTVTGNGLDELLQIRNKTKIKAINGHKIYCSAYVKANKDATVGRLQLYASKIQFVFAETNLTYNWEKFSGITTLENQDETRDLYFYVQNVFNSKEEANNASFYIKYPICIDLTEAFGTGNEPTVEKMDTITSLFPDFWFDGSVSISTKDKTYVGSNTDEVYHLTQGANTIPGIQLEEGINTLKFIGTGSVTATYREGRL